MSTRHDGRGAAADGGPLGGLWGLLNDAPVPADPDAAPACPSPRDSSGGENGVLSDSAGLAAGPVPGPGAAAATADDKVVRLATLADSARRCEACELARTRTHVVFGEGSADAPLVFIGEGPGQHEDSTGRPFVGRSGQLLDECMRENGITRKHVYICNVIRCRACVHEGGHLQNRPPTPQEVAACSTWLDQTMAIIKPRVILCLGVPAASLIIHRGFRMMQERAQWFESRYARYAMGTLHPAYILRLQGEAYLAARGSLVADIATARQKVIDSKKEPRTTLF